MTGSRSTTSSRRLLFRNITSERACELRAFAGVRAAREAAGEGIHFSGVETRYAQQQAAVQAERREREQREATECQAREREGTAITPKALG